MVTAPVARRAILARLALGYRFLREAGERIEFADDPHHRVTRAIGRHKGGRHLRHAGCHLEPRARQLLLQERAALRFLEPELGEAPDLHRHVGVRGSSGVELGEHSRALVSLLRVAHAADNPDQYGHEYTAPLTALLGSHPRSSALGRPSG